MFQGIYDFSKRHRRKFFVATGIVAGGYLCADYLKNKFFELQDRLATERAARENLKRRFEQNQEDATFTIMALLPTLSTQILDKYPVEKITQELQSKRTERLASTAASAAAAVTGSAEGSVVLGESVQSLPSETTDSVAGSTWSITETTKKSKTELWRDLKIHSVTRIITLVYASALLVFFTRLQLNILGRKNYVASVIHMTEVRKQKARAQPADIQDDVSSVSGAGVTLPTDEELERLAVEEEELNINRMYLTFSWWLLNKGWVALSERIEDNVVEVFESVNPRSDLTLADISELIGRVQYKIDHPVSVLEVNNFINNLLPPSELESYVLSQAPSSVDRPPQDDVTEPLRELLDETSDFIESPNAVDCIQRLVHSGLTVFVNKLAGIYPPGGVDGDPAKIKLASILANVTRQAQVISAGKPFEPNEYIETMIQVPELDGFSALVYSNFTGQN